MTDRFNELVIRWAAATEGPWWSDEDGHYYRLHGVAFRIPPQAGGLLPEQVVNYQILKAPKSSKVFSPYWPNEADDAFITHAWDDVRYLIDLVTRLRKLPEQIATAISESCGVPLEEHLGGHCTFEVCAKIAREVGQAQQQLEDFDDLLDRSSLGSPEAKSIRALLTPEDLDLIERLAEKIQRKHKEQPR
ncbi:hypothetical protein AB0G15_05910 [Streptosporangium sp. NPDC023825]|uniref:hypothetical protein n=1 Tax=Streptosporangium sp. NPDC023825 TaxID=3154909 RepID=UPI0034185D0B